MPLSAVPLQLVIYGLTGALVPQENLQDQATPGAIHNITQYLETVLIPGGPVTSLNTVLTAANNGELDQVAAGFNTAVAHNYTNQLIDIVMEVATYRRVHLIRLMIQDWLCLSQDLCRACCCLHMTTCCSGLVCTALVSDGQLASQHFS